MGLTPPEHVADIPSRWTPVLGTETYDNGGSHSLYNIISNKCALVYNDPDTPETPYLVQNIRGIDLAVDDLPALEWYELEEYAGREFSNSERQAVSSAVEKLTVETIEPCLDPDNRTIVEELARGSLSVPHNRDRLAEILEAELVDTDDLMPVDAVGMLDEVYGDYLCSIEL